jgi:hypothetical protein
MDSVTFAQLAGVALILAAATPIAGFVVGAWCVRLLTRDDHGEPS